MGKRAVGLGLVVLACAVLVACGGDGTKRLTAAELTSRGNAVCAKLDTDVKAVADGFTGITFTPQQMQDFYTKIVRLVDNAVTSFKALEPPKDLEQVYDSALNQVAIDRTTLAGATKSAAAAKNLFDTGVDPFTATNQKLAAAGITACRDNGAPDSDGAGSSTTVAPGTPTTTASGTATTTVPPTTTK